MARFLLAGAIGWIVLAAWCFAIAFGLGLIG